MDFVRGSLFIVITVLTHTISAQRLCTPHTSHISSDSGVITEELLARGVDCNHTWTFTDLPTEDNILLIDITDSPLMYDVIKLYGDDFVDNADENKYHCMMLRNRPGTSLNLQLLEKMHKQYPGCRFRFGISPPVRLSYVTNVGTGRSQAGPRKFTIEYRAVPEKADPSIAPQTAEITLASRASEKSTPTTENEQASEEPNTTTEEESKSGISKITVALIALTVIIVLVIGLLITALVIRRKKNTVNKNKLQQSNFYQTIPENSTTDSGDCTMNTYDEISQKIPRNPSQDQKTVKRDVVNPLYGDHASQDNHSYEYIDLKLPTRT